jgi:fatty-acyl-CoA synthase
VATNTRQIGKATEMGPGSVVVSWLPMFHDMGLVSWLTSLFADCDAVLSTPMSFLRRPSSWLKTIHTYSGSHCPAPTFAFRYAVQRVRDKQLQGLDLSSWKTAFAGAEPIPPEVLSGFQERFGPYGLAKETLLPCYGMAEATLALTFIGQHDTYRTHSVGRLALAEGRVEAPQSAGDTLELVSCGKALEGTSLWIEDADGQRLAEETLGEVVVDGPSLFSAYYGQEPREGAFHTGDLGFLQGGELFVTGRKKDLIILRGQNHHPEEVEWVAATVPGVRMGRSAAFGITDDELGTERLCLLVEGERRALNDPDSLEQALRRKIHEESGLPIDFLMLVEPGTIPVTTSGKVRRGAAREIFLQRWTEGGIV